MKKYLFNKILIVFTFLYGFHCSSEQPILDKDSSDIVTIASPAYDYSFKTLFSKHDVLINFLNSLYYPNAQENDLKIREVKVHDPFEFSPSEKWKSIYFDVACECTAYAKNTEKLRSGEAKENYKKTIFDVEMQREVDSSYRKRSFYYGCTIFSKQLTAGKGFSHLKPVRVVSFLNKSLDDDKGVKFDYVLVNKAYKEKEGGVYLEYTEEEEPLLQFTYIQLSLFDRDHANFNDNLEAWLSLMSIEKSDSNVGSDNGTFIPLYNISLSKYNNSNIKAAIDELARIAKDHFSDYVGSFQQAIKDEAPMIDKNLIIAAAQKKAEEERQAKELALQREAEAQKQAEEERLEKEKERQEKEKALQREAAAQEEAAKYKKLFEELQKRKLEKVTPESEEDSVNPKMARKEDQAKDQNI